MKLLRQLLLPVVPIYFLITWLRNKAFDFGVLSSKSYDFPIICVGNLSAGGTGKSPMVGYLISILKEDFNTATLSRGYGRATKGFVLAEKDKTYKDLGDESFQYYENFGDNITVTVCEDRQNGIEQLRQLAPKPELIILDDAFQHRKVKAGLNILLTTYSNLFTDDMVLPSGNLREPKSGYKRAQLIVVTKCPESISDADKKQVIAKIKPQSHQHIYFSSIKYSETVHAFNSKTKLSSLNTFTLVTGIANSKPLVDFLKSNQLEFRHLEYKDHHNFTDKDIEALSKLDQILTTEKDYMRLKNFEVLKDKLYYLPITVSIDLEGHFDAEVKRFVTANL